MDEGRPPNPRAGSEIRAVIVPAGDEACTTVEIDGMLAQGRGLVRLRSFLRLCRRPIDAAEARQPQIDQLDGRLGLGMAVGGAVRVVEAPGNGSAVPPVALARQRQRKLELVKLAEIAQIAGEPVAPRGGLDPISSKRRLELI